MQLCQRNCHALRRQLGHGPLQAANFIPFGLFLCVGLEPEDHLICSPYERQRKKKTCLT